MVTRILFFFLLLVIKACIWPGANNQKEKDSEPTEEISKNQNHKLGDPEKIDGYANTNEEKRLNEIRDLFREFNLVFKNKHIEGYTYDHYEIINHTAGSHKSIKIYTYLMQKVYAEVIFSSEFSGGQIDLYILDNTIQFLFSRTHKLLDYWGAEKVRFRKEEIRLYFHEGTPFKA